jgi:pimeloyl-ACP methyl ester carboxylesterase
VAERILQANGVDLCVETFGDRDDPAILLIAGAAASMLMWREEFCAALAAGGRYVIRYDLRDTGRSVSYPTGAPGYAMRDLTNDAIGVLNALGVDRAHVVGISMSGGIATDVALKAPERVESLVLMATSPGGEGLPPMSAEFLEHANAAGDAETDWSDLDAAVEATLGVIRLYSGPTEIDEAEWRELLREDFERTTNVASSQTNHFVMDTSDSERGELEDIAASALVIHGDSDPVFPLGHPEAMAGRIPNSAVLILENTGHLILAPTDAVVVPAILRHTAPA